VRVREEASSRERGNIRSLVVLGDLCKERHRFGEECVEEAREVRGRNSESEGKGKREEKIRRREGRESRLSSPFEICRSRASLINQLCNPRTASQSREREGNRLEHVGEMRWNRRV